MRHPLAGTSPRSAHRPGRAPAHVLLGVAVGLGVIAVAAPSAAHDALVAADPAPDTVLTEAPTQVVLTFAAEQAGVGSEVVVVDGAGQVWSDGPAQVAGATVTQALTAALPTGVYTVTWRSVAGDGHPVTGTYGFAVEVPSEPSARPSPAPGASAEPSAAQTTQPSPRPTAVPSTPAVTATGAAAAGDGAEPAPWVWLAAAGVVALVVLISLGLRRWRTHD